MIKFRELINYLILNEDRWIGFQGDSEYVHENGEIKMGFWSFLDIIEQENVRVKEHFTLDDEISDLELLNPTPWAIENDKGQLCVVEIIYKDYY